MQLAAIFGIFMVLLIATLAILRIRKGGKDEPLSDEYREEDIPFTDYQNDVNKQEESFSEQTSELESQNLFDSTEYEWQEHPVGTGHWYYRGHGEEEWTYYEQ